MALMSSKTKFLCLVLANLDGFQTSRALATGWRAPGFFHVGMYVCACVGDSIDIGNIGSKSVRT